MVCTLTPNPPQMHTPGRLWGVHSPRRCGYIHTDAHAALLSKSMRRSKSARLVRATENVAIALKVQHRANRSRQVLQDVHIRMFGPSGLTWPPMGRSRLRAGGFSAREGSVHPRVRAGFRSRCSRRRRRPDWPRGRSGRRARRARPGRLGPRGRACAGAFRGRGPDRPCRGREGRADATFCGSRRGWAARGVPVSSCFPFAPPRALFARVAHRAVWRDIARMGSVVASVRANMTSPSSSTWNSR